MSSGSPAAVSLEYLGRNLITIFAPFRHSNLLRTNGLFPCNNAETSSWRVLKNHKCLCKCLINYAKYMYASNK